MMTRQARESYVPQIHTAPALRNYPANSPQAKARIIILALLADGRLDKAELEGLERRDVYAKVGLGREDFVSVLVDFCSDVARLPNSRGNYLLSPSTIDRLMAEIDLPQERKSLMRLIFDVICSDGTLAEGEERLFWNAIDAWNLRISDMSPWERAPRQHSERPEHYYG